MSAKRGHDDKKGGNTGKLRDHRRTLAQGAADRAEARKSRSTAEQIKLLDARPGASAKERARLLS